MTDDIPQWAKEKACELANRESDIPGFWDSDDVATVGTLRALARLIHETQPEPVDPLVIEAREIAAQWFDTEGDHSHAKVVRNGEMDSGVVHTALAGLRRGIELAREGV